MTSRETMMAERRCEGHELPQEFGQNLSDEDLKSWFSNYGWIYLSKITNNSSNKITFYNPYLDRTRDIEAGGSDTSSCTGYFPLWSNSSRYEITYYNKACDDWKKMTIKDLDGNWWLSFEQDGIDEDIRTFRPATYLKTFIDIVINDKGYEVYSPELNCKLASLTF